MTHHLHTAARGRDELHTNPHTEKCADSPVPVDEDNSHRFKVNQPPPPNISIYYKNLIYKHNNLGRILIWKKT